MFEVGDLSWLGRGTWPGLSVTILHELTIRSRSELSKLPNRCMRCSAAVTEADMVGDGLLLVSGLSPSGSPPRSLEAVAWTDDKYAA